MASLPSMYTYLYYPGGLFYSEFTGGNFAPQMSSHAFIPFRLFTNIPLTKLLARK